MMEIVRMKLTPDDISPPNLRTEPATGVMQFSPDGGTTWVDAPGFDPRYSDVYRMPSLTGDVRCDVAARIIAQWQETLDLFISTTTTVEATTSILALIVGLITGGAAGLLFAIIVAVLEGLLAIGKAAIVSAFTSTVWDEITCIVYCHIDEDGQVSAEQRDAIMYTIGVDYPGTIAGTLGQLNNLYGEVLLSNAGVVRTETGDCTECACDWECSWQFPTDGKGIWDVWNSRATWVPGVGFESVNNVGGWPTIAAIAPDLTLPAGTEITEIWVTTNIIDGSGGTAYFFYDLTGGLYYPASSLNCPIGFVSNTGGSGVKDWMIEVVFGVETGYTITAVSVKGTGENPFTGTSAFDPSLLCP